MKRRAGGKDWVICYLGYLVSESHLLLARYKIGSVCPFDGSDWSQSLWTCLHYWPSFFSPWIRCLTESNANKLKMKEEHSFEISESICNSTSCRNPEGYHMSSSRRKNLINFKLAQFFFGFCLIPPFIQVSVGILIKINHGHSRLYSPELFNL